MRTIRRTALPTSTAGAGNRAPRRRRRPRTPSAEDLSSRRLQLRGKYEVETGAARLVGAITQPRFVRLDDRSADRESEPGTGGLRREERFEYPLLDFADEAGAQVAHRHFDVAGLRGPGRDAHFEPRAVARTAELRADAVRADPVVAPDIALFVGLGLEGVVNQVHQHLLDLHPVDRHARQRRCEV